MDIKKAIEQFSGTFIVEFAKSNLVMGTKHKVSFIDKEIFKKFHFSKKDVEEIEVGVHKEMIKSLFIEESLDFLPMTNLPLKYLRLNIFTMRYHYKACEILVKEDFLIKSGHWYSIFKTYRLKNKKDFRKQKLEKLNAI